MSAMPFREAEQSNSRIAEAIQSRIDRAAEGFSRTVDSSKHSAVPSKLLVSLCRLLRPARLGSFDR